MHRKGFLRHLAGLASLAGSGVLTQSFVSIPGGDLIQTRLNSGEQFYSSATSLSDRSVSSGTRAGEAARISILKTSLNAYSFNQPLSTGKMTIEELVDFCADAGFDGVDLTGYYFPGYPQVPRDEFIYRIKRKAFKRGLGISGTGVRNDFTHTDPGKLKESLELVKQWIGVAAKLGAPVIRVFSGTQQVSASVRPEIVKQVIDHLKVCADFGKEKGVIVALQNHDDFLKTGDEIMHVVKSVNHEWFGLVLDIGSYRTGDPFKQIAQTAPHAVNWQIKENMFVDGKEVTTDLKRVIGLVRNSGYSGYLPIETLGPGDPLVKVPAMLAAVKKELAD